MGQVRKVLFWSAGRVGEMESKAISASNLKLKLKLTEAELGKSVKEATRKCHRNFKEEFDKRSVNVVLSN